MVPPPKLRPLLPLTSNGPPLPPQPQISQAHKRKRPQVSAACNGCRKRKVKCDGVRPTCYACAASKTPCVYPVPEGLSQREAQKQKLSNLSRAHESSRMVLELLRASCNDVSHDILHQLQHSEHLDEAIQAIADASLLLPEINEQSDEELPRRTPSRGRGPVGGGLLPRRASGSSDWSIKSVAAASFPPAVVSPVSRWTSVCQDDRLMTELIDIFWVWDATLSRIVDRSLFMADLGISTTTQQHQTFCSPLLVNALLAVSSLHATRRSHASFPSDILNLAERFASQAFDHLEQEKQYPSVTLLQGQAILWVFASSDVSHATRSQREILAGSLQQTWSALGHGMEVSKMFKMPLPDAGGLGSDRLQKAASSISWGIYCFFSKMALVFSPKMITPKPLIKKTFENLESISGGGSSVSSSVVEASLNSQMQIFSAECSLCQIIDEFVSTFVGKGARAVLDGSQCTKLYNKLLCWKLALPDHLTASNGVLPSVLLLQSTYDFVALKLLTHFTASSNDTVFDGRDALSLQVLHACSMVMHLWIYRGLYAIENEYWAVENCAVAAQALLPRLQAEPATHDIVARACCILHEAGAVSGRARALLADIEERARHEGIRLPTYGAQSPGRPNGVPMVVVQGARVFDGAGGCLLDAAGGTYTVEFSGTIADVRRTQVRGD